MIKTETVRGILDGVARGALGFLALVLAVTLSGRNVLGGAVTPAGADGRVPVGACRVEHEALPLECSWTHRAPICGEGEPVAGVGCYWYDQRHDSLWYIVEQVQVESAGKRFPIERRSS